jgi:ribulose bisphosphate carboxylase small subunit
MKITVTYTAKWQLKTAPWYKWTECCKLINTKTGKEISKTIKGSQAGYYISRKFIKLDDLRNGKLVELIIESDCPF